MNEYTTCLSNGASASLIIAIGRMRRSVFGMDRIYGAESLHVTGSHSHDSHHMLGGCVSLWMRPFWGLAQEVLALVLPRAPIAHTMCSAADLQSLPSLTALAARASRCRTIGNPADLRDRRNWRNQKETINKATRKFSEFAENYIDFVNPLYKIDVYLRVVCGLTIF